MLIARAEADDPRTQFAATVPWSATIGYHYDPIMHRLDTFIDLAGGKSVQ